MNIDNENNLIFKNACADIEDALNTRGDAWRVGGLATIAQNSPEVRQVILRGMDIDTGVITIFTDKRSRKVKQINDNENCGLLLWCPHRQQQIRIKASAKLKEPPTQEWLLVKSKSALLDYAGSFAPGENLTNNAWFLDEDLAAENFAVIELTIISIDRLWLNEKGHRRAFISRDEGYWIAP